MAGVALGHARSGWAWAGPVRPTADQLQDGDLLFPRPPHAWIPYLSNAATPAADQQAYEAAKRAFLAARPKTTAYFRPEDYERIRQLSYADFRSRYDHVERERFVPILPLGANFSVGHVAIVGRSGHDAPYIVEAWLGAGKVIKHPFAEWDARFARQYVFQGRFKALTPAQRTAFRAEAEKQVGARYDFWNFNLNDDSGFYCSKLVWLAAFRALRLAVDGNSDPERVIWFSPKQQFNCASVDHLNGCCYAG
jgi:hypothetical protein